MSKWIFKLKNVHFVGMGTVAHPPAFVFVVGLSSFTIGFCCVAELAVVIIVLLLGLSRVTHG